uniref:Reverse transcriptase n=2 Tax=Lygus hesperus TaxID=30085 RepID=A0A0K8SPN6_LYGHE
MYDWWLRLESMDASRLPKICYSQLKALAGRGEVDIRYNWAHQMKTLLDETELSDLWETTDLATLKKNKKIFLNRLSDSLRTQDADRARLSSYNVAPRNYSSPSGQCAGYLSFPVPLYAKRLLAQVRTAGSSYSRVTLSRIVNVFDNSNSCSICNTGESDSLFHLLGRCPIFRSERRRFFAAASMEDDEVGRTLELSQLETLHNTVGYLQTVLRQRAFIVTEGNIALR